jgi:hypothetical protein
MERFWSKVKIGEADQCWEWQAGCDTDGYGMFWFNGRMVHASRVAYMLANGSVEEQCVLHTCDNPPCCNPAHLFPGTHQDNTLDMRAKGRGVDNSGENHGMHKLTEPQVIEIRQLYATQQFSQAELGRRYGYAPATISDIVRRVSWKRI